MRTFYVENGGHKHILRSEVGPEHEGVCTLASPDMAPFLFKRRADPINICSDNFFRDDNGKLDLSPEGLQIGMVLATEHGAWRLSNPDDYNALCLAHSFHQHNEEHPVYICPEIIQALSCHPAWLGGLGFATGGMSSFGVVQTFVEIYDIMRFS